MYIPYKKLAVVEIPKCASTTLTSVIPYFLTSHSVALHATLNQYKEVYPDILSGVALIREPLDRLLSAVQFSIDNGSIDVSVESLRNTINGLKAGTKPSVGSVVFCPQYSFLMSDVPVRLYHISKINLLLSDLGIFDAAPRLGASKPNPAAEICISGLGESFLRSFYSIDFALYKDIVSSEGGFLELKNPREYFYSIR